MKDKKYLSIAIGLMEHLENRPHKHNADRLYDSIVTLQTFLNEKGMFFNETDTIALPTGTLNLKVTNKHYEGIIAQVKCFPMKPNDTASTFNNVDGRINFIRSYTAPDGTLCIKLPIYDPSFSKYCIEVSKGSEYEIKKIEVTLHPNKQVIISTSLSPFANLKDLGWHAGDLHHHSIYSSPVYGGTDPVVETPQEVAYSMQAAGLRYGALSDHHNTLNHPVWLQTASSDFTPIVSKEISTSNGHVLSLNVPIDVIYKIPEDEARTEDYLRKEFIRTTDEIKTHGGLAQINHPRDLSTAISLSPKFTDMIEIFDTMEIWNGSNPMCGGTTNYAAFLLWLDLLSQDRFIPATTGSDTHNIAANDYNLMLDRISWMIDVLKPILTELPSELQSEAIYLINVFEKTTPLLEKWAENTLGSGCVRTYVHLEDSISPSGILQSLKQGNSFLTNGPLLLPSINGSIPGESVETSAKEITIDLKLLANKPLKHLHIYNSNKMVTTIELKNAAPENSSYFDYSQSITNFDISESKWLFFVAADDCCNLALTNPIFITRNM